MIVRLAAEEQYTLGGTRCGHGLSGGALALQGGILLVLARMRTIRSIDTANRRAVVEAGVVNQHLVAAANAAGFTYAPDPGAGAQARSAATLPPMRAARTVLRTA